MKTTAAILPPFHTPRFLLPVALCSALGLAHCENTPGENASILGAADAGGLGDASVDGTPGGGDAGTQPDAASGPRTLTADNFRGYLSAKMHFRPGGNQVFGSAEFFAEPKTDAQRAGLKTLGDHFVAQLVPKAGCVKETNPARPGDPPGLERFEVGTVRMLFGPSTPTTFEILKLGPGDHFASGAGPAGSGPFPLSFEMQTSPLLAGDKLVSALSPLLSTGDGGATYKFKRGQAQEIQFVTHKNAQYLMPGSFVQASLGFASTRTVCTALASDKVTIPADVIDGLPANGDVELRAGSTGAVPAQGGMIGFFGLGLALVGAYEFGL